MVTVHSLSMIRSLESLFQLDRWVMTAIHPREARRRFKDDQGLVAGTSYSMPHILHIYLIHGDKSIVYLAIFILSPSNEPFEQVNTGLGQCGDLPRMGMWLWVNTVHMLVQQCHKHMDPDGFHPNHVFIDKHGVFVWMVMVLLWFYHGFYHGKLPQQPQVCLSFTMGSSSRLGPVIFLEPAPTEAANASGSVTDRSVTNGNPQVEKHHEKS